ncbi:MAG: hypothetical protein ACJ0E6_05955 [Gammaproteobacteria bacterium]
MELISWPADSFEELSVTGHDTKLLNSDNRELSIIGFLKKLPTLGVSIWIRKLRASNSIYNFSHFIVLKIIKINIIFINI